jgi:AcrR family transcriptional regulator
MSGADEPHHTENRPGGNQPSEADTIAIAAVRLAGERGWRNLTLGDIALEAGVTLSALARCYGSRQEILDGFERFIDRRMLAGAIAGDVDDKPRDRLFDIIMERFDALLPYRDGVKRITRDALFDPLTALTLAAAAPRSLGWMFTGARIAADGPAMPLKLAVLGGVYLATFRVWLDEESQDLSKTMATLDKQLDRAMSLIGGSFGSSRPGEPVPSEGPPDVAEPEPQPPAPAVAAAAKKPARKKAAPRKKPSVTDNTGPH